MEMQNIASPLTPPAISLQSTKLGEDGVEVGNGEMYQNVIWASGKGITEIGVPCFGYNLKIASYESLTILF